jgi:crotonobetainyl-CoA:carnitine CoA-transferase CaiB-like acyl-CoA transferase
LHTARELFEGNVLRGDLDLGGRLLCYRPYACADGYVTLAALEPKFWVAWCRGVERENLIAEQFSRPGTQAHREVERIMARRTRAEWATFNDEHDCCLEPVLDLDEALASPLTAAREMLVDASQPGGAVQRLGVPIKLSMTPGDPARRPAPALGEHTEEILAETGLSAEAIEQLLEVGAVAGLADDARGAHMTTAPTGAGACRRQRRPARASRRLPRGSPRRR